MKWRLLFSLLLILGLGLLTGCERPDPEVTISATMAALVAPPTAILTPVGGDSIAASGNDIAAAPGSGGAQAAQATAVIPAPPDLPLPSYAGTPTPDPTRSAQVAADGALYQVHTVAMGETLGYIAQQYGTTLDELMNLNGLNGADFLTVGQQLRVPGNAAQFTPSFKIIPDSELVYGPRARDFNVRAFASYFDSYLLTYEEEVEGQLLGGPEVVQLVAQRYSVNPRLLLAALEYRSGWLTHPNPAERTYPMQKVQNGYEGLYKQLNWAADQLNMGYYGRSEGGLANLVLGDDTRMAFAPDLNDGTSGVQYWLAAYGESSYARWLEEVGPSGFFSTFSRLFGNPFAYTVDPLWPAGLSQPEMRLPWASGETWYLTGGPHGGWAGGSAWAALDFVPHHEQLGCYPSDAWVRAMSPGIVVRSNFGAVVVDLDGDGYAGTGWAVTYMHLENRDRVPVGTWVETGDPLGHPSCEGGFSNGTHVHLSRTYNGRWVAADGQLPFVMSGWTSQGQGREYDGLLVRGDVVKEACECRGEGNAITAD